VITLFCLHPKLHTWALRPSVKTLLCTTTLHLMPPSPSLYQPPCPLLVCPPTSPFLTAWPFNEHSMHSFNKGFTSYSMNVAIAPFSQVCFCHRSSFDADVSFSLYRRPCPVLTWPPTLSCPPSCVPSLQLDHYAFKSNL
jgi:hypothetical protein